MSVLCANPQCKNYRKEVELDIVRDATFAVYQGSSYSDKHRFSATNCGCDKWWNDEAHMCDNETVRLSERIADTTLTLAQIEAIEKILAPTEPPSLTEEMRDLAGIGARQ